jgi:septal ring factor EnvC (AmiA/AmiB activator)
VKRDDGGSDQPFIMDQDKKGRTRVYVSLTVIIGIACTVGGWLLSYMWSGKGNTANASTPSAEQRTIDSGQNESIKVIKQDLDKLVNVVAKNSEQIAINSQRLTQAENFREELKKMMDRNEESHIKILTQQGEMRGQLTEMSKVIERHLVATELKK